MSFIRFRTFGHNTFFPRNTFSPRNTFFRHDFSFAHSLAVGSVVLLIAALCGCGKKANPRPPEVTAPNVVLNLVAGTRTDGVTLSWQPPELNAAGERLSDLQVYEVQKSEYRKGSAPSFSTIATVKAVDEAGVPIPAVSYEDKKVTPGATYDYIVRAVNLDGDEGRASQMLRISFRGSSSVIEAVAIKPQDQLD